MIIELCRKSPLLLGTERKEQAVLHSHLSQLDMELSGAYLPGQTWGQIFCAERRAEIRAKKWKRAGNCELFHALRASGMVTRDDTGG